VNPLARLFDSLAEAVSPRWAGRRMHDRAQLDAARRGMARLSGVRHEGADSSRRWRNRVGRSGSADADLAERDVLRERSRDRYYNDDLAHPVVNALADNIVGSGYDPSATLDEERLRITPEQARKLEDEAGVVWREWASSADAGLRQSFEQMQHTVLAATVLNGEAFVLPVVREVRWGSRFGLRLLHLEADRCESPGSVQSESLRDGIELDPDNAAVAYHFADAHPGAAYATARTWHRVPAYTADGLPQVLHVFDAERPEQTRGRPALSVVLSTLKDRADFREARIINAQVAACFAAFITSTNPAMDFVASTSTGTDGTVEEEIAPGTMRRLSPGESVTFSQPNANGSDFDSFLAALSRSVASALGVPYEIATRDFRGTNYSTAKAAFNEALRLFRRKKSFLVRSLCDPVYRLVMLEAWSRGLWAKEFDISSDPLGWLAASWHGGPGSGWIDPLKEAQAEQLKVGAALTSRTQSAATTDGRSWKSIAKQLVAEQQFADKIGLKLSEPSAPAASDQQPAQDQNQ